MAITVKLHPQFKEGFSTLPHTHIHTHTPFQFSNREKEKYATNWWFVVDTQTDIVNTAFLSVFQLLMPRGDISPQGRRMNVNEFQVGFSTAWEAVARPLSPLCHSRSPPGFRILFTSYCLLGLGHNHPRGFMPSVINCSPLPSAASASITSMASDLLEPGFLLGEREEAHIKLFLP